MDRGCRCGVSGETRFQVVLALLGLVLSAIGWLALLSSW